MNSTENLRKRVLETLADNGLDPIICGSAALFVRGLTTKTPGDLDLAVKSSEFEVYCQVFEKLGGTIFLDRPNSVGFDLRRQYKINGEKFDLFIVGEHVPRQRINGWLYVDPITVWAARGYYAAMGSVKYQNQLIEQGIWSPERKPKRNLTIHFKRVSWFFGGLIKRICS